MMKKQYIQPVVKTQAIATENILDNSKTLKIYNSKPTDDNDANSFAKRNNIWE